MIKDINNIPKLRKQLGHGGRVKIGVFGENSHMAMVMHVQEFGAIVSQDKEKTRKAMRYLFAKMKEEGIPIKPKTKNRGKIIIPERAPMRNTFDDRKILEKIFRDARIIFSLGGNVKQILTAIGEKMVNGIQQTIADGLEPGQHPYTTAAKGGKNKPLINEGRLRQSIQFEVKL